MPSAHLGPRIWSWPTVFRRLTQPLCSPQSGSSTFSFHGRLPGTMTAVALTIAGSDSSGGAGIQADLKTFAAFGVYGASAITALTAQNTRGVFGIHPVPSGFVTAQIDAVFDDLDVGAVKIGMVAELSIIAAIVTALSRWKAEHVVLDPVMVASSGKRLLSAEAVESLRRDL